MAEMDAYILSPIGVVFDVAGFFAMWGGDGSWGPSIRGTVASDCSTVVSSSVFQLTI